MYAIDIYFWSFSKLQFQKYQQLKLRVLQMHKSLSIQFILILARNKRAVAVGDPLNTETTTTEAPEPPEPTDPPRTSWRRRNRVGGARNSTTGSRRSLRKTRLGGARNSTTGGSRRRSRTNRIQSSGNSTVAGSRASRRNRRKNRRLQQQASTTEAP